MSEGTDSVLRSLATAWKKGNWLAGTDATKMHPNPGGGRGEVRGGGGTHVGGRIFCRRGLPLCTCCDISTCKEEESVLHRASQNCPDDPDTASVSPKLSASVSSKVWGVPCVL